ncbi:unnamed protein product [Meganyctiphanes norvegica]|uniref:Uncharacterized protein n=1 Tax=Meganyctiphanes norvegica TaxID=48144 RepID=A0AAV2RJY6_MEGNR
MAIIIVLLSLLPVSFGDLATHVYPDHCKPPPGYNNSKGDDTTPGYITMMPVERCCPQCDKCKHLGGFCALKWAVKLYPQCCDFEPVEPCRDYGCKCCIKCGSDECSRCVETGGNCRLVCRAGELEDEINVCSYYNNGTGCKCCKSCEATSECTDAYGICVTDPYNCPTGTYASTGCCGGCYCCKPVLVPNLPSGCQETGAYCATTGDCAIGFYSCFGDCIKTLYIGGLYTTELGFCCTPKQKASRSRSEAVPFLLNQQGDNHKHPRQLFV